ncbi:MAG: hypothetical protein A2Y14_02945 [Verrucomicrobia bacterium GWF2_51_19]|nr:MAG: hypothetical protein A2Y14_02945 [Verrucomicrobia bacterium GWF2_51_19]HCJ11588.1 hypothetical protein [Opitutae bacterium]
MRILIIKPSSLGDIIHGLQMADVLKKNLNAHITWVARDCFAPIVRACEAVDNIIVFERSCWGFWKVMRAIRAETFDVVLDLQGLARTGLWTFFARAKDKYGRSDARELSGLFYSKKAALPSSEVPHALDILLNFLPLFGQNPEVQVPLAFKPTPVAPELMKAILLFPESRRQEKEWPHFEALTEALIAHFPQTPIAWLGNVYKPTQLSSAHFFNLMGETGLELLPSLMQTSVCVVANDSGPMHLAAALQMPVVALFGPTDERRFGPYPLSEKRNTVLSCQPLAKLPVKRVLEAIVECIQKRPIYTS